MYVQAIDKFENLTTIGASQDIFDLDYYFEKPDLKKIVHVYSGKLSDEEVDTLTRNLEETRTIPGSERKTYAHLPLLYLLSFYCGDKRHCRQVMNYNRTVRL